MRNILFILEIGISVTLMVLILLQAKGSGLGAAFGGDGGFYRSKRGVEKLFIYLTIIFAALFLVLALLLSILPQASTGA